MTGPGDLSDVHRQYLRDHAITDEVIAAAGICSEGDVIVFPWRDGDLLTRQRRLWPEPEDLPPDAPKYIWETDKSLHFAAWRPLHDDSGPVILVEGTKQSLAVASWAPPEYAVYGMAGCDGWRTLKLTRLNRFRGRDVFIILDADASTNLRVYEAGEQLAERLKLAGARPQFVTVPGRGKEGIDDELAIDDDDRTGKLVTLSGDAAGKPASRRPPARPQQPDSQPGRPVVMVDGDRQQVIREVIFHLQQRWNGTELFCYGGALTRLREARTEPLSKGAFLRWLAECVACYRGGAAGFTPSWPDPPTIDALLASADEFARLDRVVAAPFIADDGTVVLKNGYDPSSATFLAMGNSGMDRLDIPEAPSQADAQAAARYLLDEWLGDIPFLDQSSRAGALTLVLTPFIRGLVPLVPLAVVSARQKGTGKNLLADCLAIVATGEPAVPMHWIEDDDDESRKQLLSAFREGRGLIVFDEAHKIASRALSRALTAQTYTDRLLGVSQMLSYPNRAVWMALGNNVEVSGDMARRHYRIDLISPVPEPENRPASAFAHPDLRSWTAGARPELVTAILTVLRAWYAAGQPEHGRGMLMGSFERWDEIMSGVLHYAGVPGFLADDTEKRSEADFSGGFWREHIAWLRGNRGNYTPFTTAQVRQDALDSLGSWCALPGLDNLSDPAFARKLGQEYARHRDEWSGGLRLAKVGHGFNNVVKWQVEEYSGYSGNIAPDLGEGQPRGNEPGLTGIRGEGQRGVTSIPYAYARAPAHDALAHMRAHVHTREGGNVPLSSPSPLSPFSADLETADADDLFTYTHSDDTGYVRLAGLLGPSGVPVIASAADALPLLSALPAVWGHNFLGFDLLALAWHHGADWDELAPGIRDTELIARQYDPPRSRESGSSEDKYGLDAVAERLGLPGKTDELARLKRKHGGYDTIPLDDPEYQDYLRGDLAATAAVAGQIGSFYDTDPYISREHTLAVLAGRMTLNGFAVDQELLARRLADGEAKKRLALSALHDGWGLPLSKVVMRGRGKARHEETEVLDAPLGSDGGRAWLEQMYERYQWPRPPRTQKTGKLAIGSDELSAVAADPACPGELRQMIALMNAVTGTRTVYQTARDCLAPDGRVHPRVSMRQASGRWSVTQPGLTVFGKRGGRHIERDIFLPDYGHVLLSFDLRQVDMRAMAWLSQDHAYRAMFAPGRDAHAEIGGQVGLDRQAAKAIGHGWNYGLGRGRMIRNGLDPDAVDRFIAGMEARFPQLISWREQIRAMGAAGQILENGFGRRMRCDPDRAYTVAPALMGQGGARDIMCECLLRLPRDTWPLLRVMVHDEVVMSVPAPDAAEVADAVLRAMTWQLDDDLPVLCDLKGGANWGEASA